MVSEGRDQKPHIRRIILTEQQACEIYDQRLAEPMKPTKGKIKGQSRLCAERYGVSPKTIRDIWNKKTWCFATRPKDISEVNHIDPLADGRNKVTYFPFDF